ncbi:FAD-dependent oxidoreductase [Bradyrhizobium sp. Pha-3]|uniref:FAD-dependent oxidoreductase n=1 Tax=Bradyrhizobium sp. Pha-3 TaxID=208375 RepID=UPI0035D46186
MRRKYALNITILNVCAILNGTAMGNFWLKQAYARLGEPQVRSLSTHVTADVTIVGGGYLGLWTAIPIKERSPSLKIAVVERDLCGAGASGRNGGFVTSYWAKYLSLHKICGTDEATRIAKSSAEAVLKSAHSAGRMP